MISLTGAHRNYLCHQNIYQVLTFPIQIPIPSFITNWLECFELS